jgi:hypothetical protein
MTDPIHSVGRERYLMHVQHLHSVKTHWAVKESEDSIEYAQRLQRGVLGAAKCSPLAGNNPSYQLCSSLLIVMAEWVSGGGWTKAGRLVDWVSHESPRRYPDCHVHIPMRGDTSLAPIVAFGCFRGDDMPWQLQHC